MPTPIKTDISIFPTPTTDARFLQFVLHNTPTYLANGLRRCLIADVKAPGIANAYAHKRHKNRTRLGAQTADVTDTDGSTVSAAGSGIHIHTNTGRINNEMLRLRLALLPIGVDPSTFNTPDGGKLILRLNKKCPANAEEPVAVTSEDVVLVKLGGDETVDTDVDAGVEPTSGTEDTTDNTDLSENHHTNKHETTNTSQHVTDLTPYLLPEATQLIPTDPVVDRVLQKTLGGKPSAHTSSVPSVPKGILITRLYPEESLAVDLYPGIGCSRDFAGFSPLHTCTYQQLPCSTTSTSSKSPHPSHHDFQFTIQSLGAYTPHTLVKEGLQQLHRKVTWFREQLRPNTIVLDFGSTAYPSLHKRLSSSTRTCWVKWSDVDFLTRLQAPDAFYRLHCHDVLAVTTEEDVPIRTTAFKPSERIPSVDSEDVVETTSNIRHILALHQPDYASNGVYEYDASSRTYTRVPQAHTTFLIAKDGRTQRAKVFTQAELVAVHDTCCVLRFGEAVTPTIMEHIRTHIDGLVCAGGAGGAGGGATTTEPSVPLCAPKYVRPDITFEVTDNGHICTLTVPQEDHTLGNLVQGWVYDRFLRTDGTDGHTLPHSHPHSSATSSASHKPPKRHDLLAFGYKQPLPSERTIVFRAEFERDVGEEGGGGGGGEGGEGGEGEGGDGGVEGAKRFGEILGEWVDGVGGMVEGVVAGWMGV